MQILATQWETTMSFFYVLSTLHRGLFLKTGNSENIPRKCCVFALSESEALEGETGEIVFSKVPRIFLGTWASALASQLLPAGPEVHRAGSLRLGPQTPAQDLLTLHPSHHLAEISHRQLPFSSPYTSPPCLLFLDYSNKFKSEFAIYLARPGCSGCRTLHPGFEFLVLGAWPQLGLRSNLTWTPGQCLNNTCHRVLNSQDLHFCPDTFTSLPILQVPSWGHIFRSLTGMVSGFIGRWRYPVWAGPPIGLGASHAFPHNTPPGPATLSSPPPWFRKNREMQPFLSGLLSHPLYPSPLALCFRVGRVWDPGQGLHVSGPRGVLERPAPADKPIVQFAGILRAGCEW